MITILVCCFSYWAIKEAKSLADKIVTTVLCIISLNCLILDLTCLNSYEYYENVLQIANHQQCNGFMALHTLFSIIAFVMLVFIAFGLQDYEKPR